MKMFWSFLGGLLEWVVSILWLPVHFRALLQARTIAAHQEAQAYTAQQLFHTAGVMMNLHAMGSDTKPLARFLAGHLHQAYGVTPSAVNPGVVVPIDRNEKREPH